MGSPDFAVPALTALHGAGHEIAAVYTQPPRPAGRGQAEQPCAVHRAAAALGLEVRHPARLRGNAEAAAEFAALGLDAAVVAAYGLILPPTFLAAPARGCLNIHASLLPRWRGAAPIHAAILAGDAATGVTIMQMDEGLDTGAMLLACSVPITATTTTPALHDALAAMGARLILRALDEAPAPVAQPATGATYAPRLTRADAVLDWRQDAAALERRVRAMIPWPGTIARLGDLVLKVQQAEIAPGQEGAAPGTVLDAALRIACGGGTALRLLRVQAPGRAAMAVGDFLRGHPIAPGLVFSP
ncbi:MAG: methionyl-tRNA formyltransferase [Rhodospirillales bacterium]|nr:methionyl-tRNA formyltransferase [Rhodospirillales bacterium]